MSHSYSSILYHCVWGTKEREPLLSPPVNRDVYAYINGIVKQERGLVLAIGGMPDHLHLLIAMTPQHQPANFIRVIKANSSKFINQEALVKPSFSWQEGYGIFSVSKSMAEKVDDYINRQEEHHKQITFTEEYYALLKKHDIIYNPKYVLG